MSFRSALVLAAAFAGAPALAAPPAADYVAQAGASDKYEMDSSKLVLATSKNAGVRSYANMMVKDHTKSTAEVKAAARSSGLTPKPPVLNSEQQANIAKLKAAKGADRDREYVTQQKTSHQEALSLQQDYSQSGDKPALKTVAGKIVPVVQHHIDMLNQMPAA